MYNRRVRKAYLEADIFKTKQSLEKTVKNYNDGKSGTTHAEFIASFAPKFNAFHSKTRLIRQKEAAKMNKIRAGGQDFSPKGQALRDTIDFWKRILRRKQGVRTSRAMLRKQAKRLNLSLKHLTNMTQANVQNKISSAYKAYNLAKSKLPKWREEFQVSLVNALASVKDKSPKVIIAQMKREKHQKLLGIKSRIIRQKHKNDPILQATATNEAGQVYQCTDES